MVGSTHDKDMDIALVENKRSHMETDDSPGLVWDVYPQAPPWLKPHSRFMICESRPGPRPEIKTRCSLSPMEVPHAVIAKPLEGYIQQGLVPIPASTFIYAELYSTNAQQTTLFNTHYTVAGSAFPFVVAATPDGNTTNLSQRLWNGRRLQHLSG